MVATRGIKVSGSEGQREARTGVALQQAHETAVCRHDLAGEREADTRPAFLGREERHEDAVGDVVGHAGTIVRDFEDDVAAPVQSAAEMNLRRIEMFDSTRFFSGGASRVNCR